MVGIVGDVTTGPTVAVAQASVADNMPCVTPSATAADVVTYGANYFRACVTDPEQGRVMANFAAEQGYKNVGTLFLNGDDYSQGVNDAFVEEAEAKGITIAAQESMPTATSTSPARSPTSSAPASRPSSSPTTTRMTA